MHHHLSKYAAFSLAGAVVTICSTKSVVAFVGPSPKYLHNIRTSSSSPSTATTTTTTSINGYLDNLTRELNAPDSNPDPDGESRDATKMDKSQVTSYGPGSFQGFIDFDEFDGGDGQMGVSGDGKSGLDKMDDVPQIAKSKMMSAKNAWGTSSGYADKLRDQNPKMDTARAQQLENWSNQQEVRGKNQQLKEMSDNFDSKTSSAEENWRQLAKFGVERTQDFDMDETFGPVTVGNTLEGVIVLKTAMNKVVTHDIFLRNPYMGFSDFRAAFTSDTPMDWSVEPREGSLKQREDTHFIVKFRPQGPGLIQGYLVIETEDVKKTWQVQGST